MTTRRFPLFVLGALTAGALSVRAQTAQTAAPAPAAPTPAPTDMSVTFTPTYVSSYMFRGQRLAGNSFQSSLEGDEGAWDFGVWDSWPIRNQDKVPGQSEPEIDPYGSYTLGLPDGFSLQPGFTWYTYPRAQTANGFYRDTFEPNVALNYEVGGLKLTPKYYYDVVTDTSTYEFGAQYAVPLKQAGTELDFNGAAGTYFGHKLVDHSPLGVIGWGDYWLLGVSAPFQITKNSKLTVGWAYTRGYDSYRKMGAAPQIANAEALGRGVATVSYSWTF